MSLVRVLLVAGLLFLAATALYGGVVLILNAHGNPWGMMPLALLQHSPFRSWMIPGIVLLTANGLLAIWVLGLVLTRERQAGTWTMAQGGVLLGWLTVECVMLRTVIGLHYLYGALGVALIVAGAVLQLGARRSVQPQ